MPDTAKRCDVPARYRAGRSPATRSRLRGRALAGIGAPPRASHCLKHARAGTCGRTIAARFPTTLHPQAVSDFGARNSAPRTRHTGSSCRLCNADGFREKSRGANLPLRGGQGIDPPNPTSPMPNAVNLCSSRALASLLCLVGFSCVPVVAQFVEQVNEVGSPSAPKIVVRHQSDVIGISGYGSPTVKWDPINSAWNEVTPGDVWVGGVEPGMFTTRANKATYWASGTLLEWDGSQWVAPTPSVTGAPTATQQYSLAGLPNGEMILFGGVGASGFLNETWKLSAQNVWSLVVPTASSPSPRVLSAMAADSTGSVVLFGGGDATTNLADTWSFNVNGPTWSQVAVSGTPPDRVYGVLVHRPSTSSFTLLGGLGGPQPGVRLDAWVLTGTTWTQAPASYADSPGGWVWSGALAANDEVVAAYVNTGTLVIGALSGFASVGAGCACPGTGPGALTLGATGTTVLGGSHTLTFSGYALISPLVLVFDVAPAVTPVTFPGFAPGCNQNIATIAGSVLVAASPPAAPAPTVVLNVPDTTVLIGARTVFQAVQPPFSNPFPGFAGCVSNALDVRIGRF